MGLSNEIFQQGGEDQETYTAGNIWWCQVDRWAMTSSNKQDWASIRSLFPHSHIGGITRNGGVRWGQRWSATIVLLLPSPPCTSSYPAAVLLPTTAVAASTLGCAFRRNSGGIPTECSKRHRHVPFRPRTGTRMCYNTDLDIPVHSGWYLSTRFLQVENARNYSK